MNEADHAALRGLRSHLERLQRELGALSARLERLEAGGAVRASDRMAEPLAPPAPLIATSGPKPPPMPVEASRPVVEKSAWTWDTGEAQPPRAARPPGARGSFEMRIGVTWLVRVGMLLLLTALVYAGWLAWDQYRLAMGPGARTALLYVLSAGLTGAGMLVSRQGEGMRGFAQVVIAGGLAAFYYVTYAAHHVETLRVIHDPAAASALLGLVALVIVCTAVRWDSPLLAAAAFALAFYTSLISGLTWFSLVSNVILALAATVLQLRRGWTLLSFVALAATYGGYIYWRVMTGASLHSDGAAFGILTTYWGLFALGAAWPSRGPAPRAALGALAIANSAFWTALAGEALYKLIPNEMWLALGGMGLVHLGIAAVLSVPVRSRGLRLVFSLMGAGFLTLALVMKFSGAQLAVFLALETLALAAIGAMRSSLGLRVASVLAGLLAVYGLATSSDSSTLKTVFTTMGAAVFLAAASLASSLGAKPPASPNAVRVRVDEGFLGLCAAVAAAIAASQWEEPWARIVTFAAAGLVLAGGGILAGRPALLLCSLVPFVGALFHVMGCGRQESLALAEFLHPAALFGAAGLARLNGKDQDATIRAVAPFLVGGALLVLTGLVFRWFDPFWVHPALLLMSGVLLDARLAARAPWLLWAGCAVLVCVLISALDARAATASLLTGPALLLPAIQALRTGRTARAPLAGTQVSVTTPVLVLVSAILMIWSGRQITERFGGQTLTVAWGACGFLCLAAGLWLKERSLRLAGLGILALALARALLHDVWALNLTQRLVVFVVLGSALTIGGFFYNKLFGGAPSEREGEGEGRTGGHDTNTPRR